MRLNGLKFGPFYAQSGADAGPAAHGAAARRGLAFRRGSETRHVSVWVTGIV